MTRKVNCWEHLRCDKEPGRPCPVFAAVDCDGVNGGTNGGRFCWTVSGTRCGGRVQGSAAEKIATCRECSFYKRVKYEEGCRFQQATPGLGTSDGGILHRRINGMVRVMSLYRDVLAGAACGPLLDRVAELAREVTASSASAVYLVDDSKAALALRSRAGAKSPAFPERIALSDDTPAASAVRSRAACAGIGLFVAPIGGGDGPAGSLVVAKAADAFSTDDEWFLGELAVAAALGLGNARLVEAARAARSADQAASKSMAMLMHQIGSPLATIACSLKALDSRTANLSEDDRRKLIACGLDRVDTVNALAKRLLCLEAIRWGGCLTDRRAVRPADVLRREVEVRLPQARQKGLKLSLRVRDADARVWADPDGLGLIFGNLIDNAIKYSKAPGARIDVASSVHARLWSVSVRDHGVGIPAEDQAGLFSEFRRASNAWKPGTHSFGLGLAIVRELVDCYEGRIEMRSRVGAGTKVVVRFPLSGSRKSTGRQVEGRRSKVVSRRPSLRS